jgi:hypothetical protein
MKQEGAEQDWAILHGSVGRYIIAAGRAEDLMFRMLVALRAANGQPAPEKAAMWSGLVDALLNQALSSPFESQINDAMQGAKRRGRLRNNIVHAGWFSAGPEKYVGRRHSAHGEGSATLFLSREVLDQNVLAMEKFEFDLGSLAERIAVTQRNATDR